MIKTIIFDCFGVVLTDTLESTYAALGGDYKRDEDKINDILERSHIGEVRSSELFASMLGVSESTWLTTLSSGRQINHELLDYIATSLKPHYHVAMLSNVGKGRISQLFEPGFLEQYFELVVASGDIGYAKPEPRAYEIVAEQLRVRLDECVFTDDREPYIEGAQSIGMHTILFKDTADFISELERLLQLDGEDDKTQ